MLSVHRREESMLALADDGSVSTACDFSVKLETAGFDIQPADTDAVSLTTEDSEGKRRKKKRGKGERRRRKEVDLTADRSVDAMATNGCHMTDCMDVP